MSVGFDAAAREIELAEGAAVIRVSIAVRDYFALSAAEREQLDKLAAMMRHGTPVVLEEGPPRILQNLELHLPEEDEEEPPAPCPDAEPPETFPGIVKPLRPTDVRGDPIEEPPPEQTPPAPEYPDTASGATSPPAEAPERGTRFAGVLLDDAVAALLSELDAPMNLTSIGRRLFAEGYGEQLRGLPPRIRAVLVRDPRFEESGAGWRIKPFYQEHTHRFEVSQPRPDSEVLEGRCACGETKTYPKEPGKSIWNRERVE